MPYKRLEDCPNRHNKKPCETCTIRLAPEYAPGLAGSEAGGKALVLSRFIGPGVTWLSSPFAEVCATARST